MVLFVAELCVHYLNPDFLAHGCYVEEIDDLIHALLLNPRVHPPP